MSTSRRRGPILGAVLLTAGVLLAGCAEEPAPELTPEPAPEFAPPAVSEERAQEILDQVEEQVSAADTSGDVEQMRARVTSPAIDFRQTQYALQTATGGAELPLPLTTESDVLVVTATDSWPRSVLAVSEPVADSTVRHYYGLVQENPRAAYQLVSWSRLLPGVPTPTFATAEIGSAPIADDQAELAMPPADALARLADVMANPASEFAGDFADDPYRTFLNAEVDGLRQGVAVAGELSTSATSAGPDFAIATADGGALVMGTVEITQTLRKTVEGSTLPLPDSWAVLDAPGPVEAAASATYRHLVTVYVPPASSPDAQLQFLGVERVLASVARTE
jgi:hypothetical protein